MSKSWYAMVSIPLNIADNRRKYIEEYSKDIADKYKYDPIMGLELIHKNLKGNERYLASYIYGESFKYLYSKLGFDNYRFFVIELANRLGISEEKEMVLYKSLLNRWKPIVEKDDRGEAITAEDEIYNIIIDILKDRNITDDEKFYYFFIFGNIIHE